jgi:hypothetical protein
MKRDDGARRRGIIIDGRDRGLAGQVPPICALHDAFEATSQMSRMRLPDQ